MDEAEVGGLTACGHCGALVPAGARFCARCGAAVVAATAELLTSTQRALLAVAFLAATLILGPLFLTSSGSLYSSADGATLRDDAMRGVYVGVLAAGAAIAALLWGSARVPRQGDLLLGAGLGAAVGLVAAFGLGTEAYGAAHADLVNGAPQTTPILHVAFAVLLVAFGVTVAVALNARRAPPDLGFMLLAAGLSCLAVAALAYDGWLLQNAAALRSAAMARAHRVVPLAPWLALAALVIVALAARRRRG